MTVFKLSKIFFAFALLLPLALLAEVQTISVILPDGIEKPRESHWRDALAAHFSKAEEDVKTEVVLRGGRCDIVTEKYAIEVDRANKWHEAIGQAAHYALYLKKKPCIALYRADTLSKAQMEAMKRTTARRRIDVILLILPD